MRKPDGRLLVSVAGRITVFLFLFSVLILLLYIQGNFQDFLDVSLFALLKVYQYTSLLFIAAAIPYVFLLIFGGRGSRRNIRVRVILAASGVVFTAAGFFITAVLVAALQPVI